MNASSLDSTPTENMLTIIYSLYLVSRLLTSWFEGRLDEVPLPLRDGGVQRGPVAAHPPPEKAGDQRQRPDHLEGHGPTEATRQHAHGEHAYYYAKWSSCNQSSKFYQNQK